MATSDVSICNNALIKLGADTITSLTDDVKNARLCNQVFEKLRDDILRAHPWNFALEQVQLARLVAAPVFSFAFKYQLPANCLRVVRMQEDYMKFKIKGRELYTDEEVAQIEYVKRVTDPTQFDALFDEVFSARIAAELATPITDSNTVRNAMFALLDIKVAEARAINGQEGSETEFRDGSWLDSRV